jgi:acyl carrier protein
MPIDDEIKALLADILGLAPAEIGPHTAIDKVPAWDSANHVNIILEIEARFGFTFPAEEIERLRGFSDLVGAVAARRATV